MFWKKTAAASAVAMMSATLPQIALAQEVGLDERINQAIAPISNVIAGTMFYSVPIAGTEFPLIVGWLVVAATIFTLYFGFVQFRRFGHAIALVEEWIAPMFGREPDVTRDAVALLSQNLYCDSRKAQRELSYRPRPLEQMVADCRDWMLQARLL